MIGDDMLAGLVAQAAAEAMSSAKSNSLGDRAMLCQVSPPSSTIGRPALAPPA